MPETTPGESRGVLDSLKTLAATLVAIAHTRLDLLATDLEEERAHLLSLLVLALVGLFFLGIGVMLAVMLLVAAFWETHRLLLLGLLAGAFVAAGIAAWAIAMRKARSKPKFFAASMSELLKDRQQLTRP
ncbi:MAG: hypothetical protein FD187_1941 [bacterium]|nr:MAG: hypothetical protein FD142_1667 [bacterium]KAF0148518.1 MAG: hypothetical protein FD187_1941 [bacterium]KAF0168062.1 MAG: hypothetical protein FD158_1789 [bacterium]TXT21192.1 MAG: hypothetical protein FD132_702 [bacterium]